MSLYADDPHLYNKIESGPLDRLFFCSNISSHFQETFSVSGVPGKQDLCLVDQPNCSQKEDDQPIKEVLWIKPKRFQQRRTHPEDLAQPEYCLHRVK